MFEQYVDKLLIEASDIHTIGLFPGAFKPPHEGHYLTAKAACEECDEVFILVSAKSRDLNTQNIATTSDPQNPDDPMNKTCDAGRYRDFYDKPKYTNNLWSREIRPCARAGSASAMRAAISVDDVETIYSNLPNGVDKDAIKDIYMMSIDDSDVNNFGRVTVEQSLMVWRIFANDLINRTQIDPAKLHIKRIDGSPVGATYDLVSNINKGQLASKTKINLYVGS